MSAAPARRLTTAGTLALALVLTSPVAAFADRSDDGARDDSRSDSRNDGRSDGRSDAGTESPSGQAQDRRGDDDAEGEASAPASTQRGAEGEASAPDSTQRGAEPAGRTEQRPDEQAREDSPGRAGGDPRGNNGTVKVDGVPFDDGRGNEPHVGCVFQVDFYGFDEGDTAGITFTGQAPTGGGLLHSESATPISDDAAGGGQDRDATLTYSVDDQLSELLTVAPHPQQGWHVKLEVDVDGAPGGAKSKVFWIDCPQPAALGGTTEPAGGEAVLDDEQSAGTPMTVSGTPVPTFGGSEAVVAQSETAVAGTTVAAVERQDELTLGAAGAAAVPVRGSRLPSALAFTGMEGLAALLALGLGAVGTGAAALRLGRRRTATDLG